MIFETFFQTALYLPLILGIFLSFRILRLTDLTADGSFVLGAGIYARLLTEGWPQSSCFLMGIVGGGMVGMVLAFIQKNNRVPSILASILCVFMLQSINMMVMGRPNIALLGYDTALDQAMESYPLLGSAVALSLLILLVGGFIKLLKSKVGLTARAFGLNNALLKKIHYYPERIRTAGLTCSNMFYALSGVLWAHMQKFSDISMGTGVSLIGISAVIMGSQLLSLLGIRKHQGFQVTSEIITCIIGMVGYFFLIRVFLIVGVEPSVIKLLVGGVLTLLFIVNKGTLIDDRHSAR